MVEPDLAEPFRGNGLAMAGFFADGLSIHKGRDGRGTTATVRGDCAGRYASTTPPQDGAATPRPSGSSSGKSPTCPAG